MKIPKRDGAFLSHVLCLLEGGHVFRDVVLVPIGGKFKQQVCCSRCGLYNGKALWVSRKGSR